MACYTDYITIDDTLPSRSGLFASDLPGVDREMLDALKKVDQSTYFEFYDRIYLRAWKNLVKDVSRGLQKKFYLNRKLISRETGYINETINSGSGLAGVRIQFTKPKYSYIHVLQIKVDADQAYASPGINIEFYEDDEDGRLLHEINVVLQEGLNTIDVDRSFEVDKLFVAYNRANFELMQTESSKLYTGYRLYDKWSCMFPCLGGLYEGSVSQINSGGLNVFYNVICSPEKYTCENLNLFELAFFYRIGIELMDEALLGNTLNKYSTMTSERFTERSQYYSAKYNESLSEAIEPGNISEDPWCFNCKGSVGVRTNLP